MFQVLHDTTNNVLDYVRDHPEEFDEAINFGDLRCADVVCCKSFQGEEFWVVEIEEADPSCVQLHDYVSSEVIRLTGIDVQITTAW